MNSINIARITVIFTISTGILLSLVQFIHNRSLWLDESLLAWNIIHQNYCALLKALDLGQVAPPLFLQIEKVCSDLIPNSELGLRLFPLISFWISVLIFYKILMAIHKNYYTIIFSLSLLIFNATLLYYSNEAKQYMSDVLVLTSVYCTTLYMGINKKCTYHLLTAIGAISIFISHIAPIILFSVGLYLLHCNYICKKHKIIHLASMLLVWVCSFVIYYVFFIHNHPSRDYMIYYWNIYDAFMPLNPLEIHFYQFFRDKGYMIADFLFHFGKVGGISLAILLSIGIICLVRKRLTGILILTITPIMLHLLLSAFKLYPFHDRLILYLLPNIIIICSFGFDCLINISFVSIFLERLKYMIICIPLMVMCLFYSLGYSMDNIEIKNSITFIEHYMDKHDKVYILNFGNWPFQYYMDTGRVTVGAKNIIYGRRDDSVWYAGMPVQGATPLLKDLSLLSGRVWFVSTRFGGDNDRMQFIKKYFESKGECIIQEFHTTGSDVYLYDIKH